MSRLQQEPFVCILVSWQNIEIKNGTKSIYLYFKQYAKTAVIFEAHVLTFMEAKTCAGNELDSQPA